MCLLGEKWVNIRQMLIQKTDYDTIVKHNIVEIMTWYLRVSPVRFLSPGSPGVCLDSGSRGGKSKLEGRSFKEGILETIRGGPCHISTIQADFKQTKKSPPLFQAMACPLLPDSHKFQVAQAVLSLTRNIFWTEQKTFWILVWWGADSPTTQMAHHGW